MKRFKLIDMVQKWTKIRDFDVSDGGLSIPDYELQGQLLVAIVDKAHIDHNFQPGKTYSVYDISWANID